MPGFDGTGPMGQGPKSGRGLGRCGRKMNRGVSERGTGRSWLGRTFDACRRRFGGRGGKRFGNTRGNGSRGFSGSRNW